MSFFPSKMSDTEATPAVEPTTPDAAPAAPAKTPLLKASERNKIIADYKAGTLHPDYEIITKKIEGKYIVKPRKNQLTEEQIQKTKPTVNEQPPTILPSVNAPKKVSFSKEGIQIQAQLNYQMLQEMKHLKKKIKKLKHRVFDEDELPEEIPPKLVPVQEIYASKEIPPSNEVGAEELLPPELEEPVQRPRRFYSKADLLNYKRFGF
jgi:hypothetical protein